MSGSKAPRLAWPPGWHPAQKTGSCLISRLGNGGHRRGHAACQCLKFSSRLPPALAGAVFVTVPHAFHGRTRPCLSSGVWFISSSCIRIIPKTRTAFLLLNVSLYVTSRDGRWSFTGWFTPQMPAAANAWPGGSLGRVRSSGSPMWMAGAQGLHHLSSPQMHRNQQMGRRHRRQRPSMLCRCLPQALLAFVGWVVFHVSVHTDPIFFIHSSIQDI